jgi:hypothetical protein
MPSFRGASKTRTRNLEIPALVLTHHPGMTKTKKPAVIGDGRLLSVRRKFCGVLGRNAY